MKKDVSKNAVGGVFALAKISTPALDERGLTAVRSRSRENNTQLFSNTLAPLRYALFAENANSIRASR